MAVVATFAPVTAAPLTTASWLTSINAGLGGARPIDVLRNGGAARVLPLAQRAAADMRG